MPSFFFQLQPATKSMELIFYFSYYTIVVSHPFDFIWFLFLSGVFLFINSLGAYLPFFFEFLFNILNINIEL